MHDMPALPAGTGDAPAARLRLSSAPDHLEFDCRAGETVLDAALRAGLTLAHACGGKARCSTCRIWISDPAHAADPAPGPAEAALKERLGLGPEIRLACQYRPAHAVSFRRLVLDESDLAVANQLDRRVPLQAGEVRNVTVLFFDVAGFTAISDRIPPYDIMFLLNKFLTRAGRILERHGGYFDKAIGDGFLAIFGVQDEAETELRAVAAALELLRAVDAAHPLMQELYGVHFDARLGLHCGEALIGALGPAGDERLTVIGDVANIASRAERASKDTGTRLLMTSDLFRRVEACVVSPDFVRMQLPGVTARTTLHEVTELTPEGRARLDRVLTRPLSGAPGRHWERLCASDDLAEGQVRVFPFSRHDVALTRRDGRVFAFNNHCPHNRLPFFGTEIPDGQGLPPAPADSTFDGPSRISCRFHDSVFDLETGRIIQWCRHLNPDGTVPGLAVLGDLSKNEAPLEVYRCRETRGEIWVELA